MAFFLEIVFFSCKTDYETLTIEVPPSSSSTDSITYTVKEATYVNHYQEKILTDDDGKKYVSKENKGFELKDSEDKNDNPIKSGTKFKDLAKDYEGFSYRYAIQAEGTVYIYYTRNTVKYTFYDNTAPNSEVLKVAETLSGTYGTTCQLPNIKINGKIVSQWNERSDGKGSPFTKEFKSKDTTFFPVQPIKDVIGTKIRPDTLGDIVFCDGSAASLTEVQAATGDTLAAYKQNAIAVIVFDKYNTSTGSATDGNKFIGVGIQALNQATSTSGQTLKSLFKNLWRANDVCPTSYVYICESFHGYNDLCDLKNLFPDYFDDDLKIARDWTAISIAMNYGNTLKEKNSMDVDDELLDGWYLPNWQELSLLLASYYKYYKTLNASRIALGMTIPTEPDSFWVTATKTQGTDPVYAAYVKEGDENNPNIYTPFKLLLNGGEYDNYWANATTEKYQILPFRVFK